jgi:anaerobic selenocysteine-containing dehydrogenase
MEDGYHCQKLAAAADIVYSPDRVRSPLIKNDTGGQITWKEATWDDALQVVAQNLDLLKTKYGAESVCWMRGMAADWGAPWDYAIRLMRAFGSPNVIGNGSVCHVAREMAHTFTYGAMTAPDYEHSKCIVLWGKNDRDCNPPGYEKILRCKQQGAKLIVIDPIRTDLASLADIWLQTKPGCDGLLAMAMLQVILSYDLYDHDFVRDWTVGFEQLAEVAEHYSPGKVAHRVWLTPDEISRAAVMYATTKPACIADGNGLDMHLDVSQNTRAVCMLRAVTGNLDRVGGDLIPHPIPTRNIQLSERTLSGIQPVTSEYPLFNSFHERRGDHTLSPVVDAILQGKPYPIRGLVIQAANPVVTMANSSRFLRALDKLEFIVVIDLFMTRTAHHASVFLPATTSFEKTQLNLGSMWSNFVILQDQVIDWVANSWPDWKIIFELAREVGCGDEFPWTTVEEAIDYQLEPAGITVEMLRQNPDGILFEDTRYEKYLDDGFDTRSGKVELYSRVFEEHGYSPIPSFEECAEGAVSFGDDTEHFPLMGISGARPNCFVHSQFRNIPPLLQREPEPLVDIHPDDLATRSLHDGDRVRIETPNGNIQMKARASDVVHPGSVRIAWGWGEFDPPSNLNNLTDDQQRDPISSTTSNRCFMCNVVKAIEP